jgi:hypothetical protein
MLDYEAGKERYEPTPEDRVWLGRRFGWYGFQVLLFFAIVYRIGPNLILFHSPFSPAPRDFVPLTSQYVQIIAGIKAYHRDYGVLPFTSMDLPPQYMPAGAQNQAYGEILNTTSITFGTDDWSVLEYEFSPVIEGWKIHSPRYDGPIPAPIVVAAAKPVAPSSSAPATSAAHGK